MWMQSECGDVILAGENKFSKAIKQNPLNKQGI